MACVGIVGGLGVGATVDYYRRIVAACHARSLVPNLVINHADVRRGQAYVEEGRLEILAEYLAGFIDQLQRAGASAAVLPAVTPHICLDRLLPRIHLPLISIFDAIAAETARRGLTRVALFGTKYTLEGGMWGRVPGVEIVKPRPDEIAFVGRAYQRLLDTQQGDAAETAGLRALAAELMRREGVEAILLAGTDLAVIFDENTAGFPCLDVARAHVDAIVERMAA